MLMVRSTEGGASQSLSRSRPVRSGASGFRAHAPRWRGTRPSGDRPCAARRGAHSVRHVVRDREDVLDRAFASDLRHQRGGGKPRRLAGDLVLEHHAPAAVEHLSRRVLHSGLTAASTPNARSAAGLSHTARARRSTRISKSGVLSVTARSSGSRSASSAVRARTRLRAFVGSASARVLRNRSANAATLCLRIWGLTGLVR